MLHHAKRGRAGGGGWRPMRACNRQTFRENDVAQRNEGAEYQDLAGWEHVFHLWCGAGFLGHATLSPSLAGRRIMASGPTLGTEAFHSTELIADMQLERQKLNKQHARERNPRENYTAILEIDLQSPRPRLPRT
jgi:hypothetical protein